MDEVGWETILLLQCVGLPMCGVGVCSGRGPSTSILVSTPAPQSSPSCLSVQLTPPPLCTHWLVSPLLQKVRLWIPPLICGIGVEGEWGMRPTLATGVQVGVGMEVEAIHTDTLESW